MSAALNAPAVETELTVATRRLMQAEENAAQAGARVLKQWNDVKAIAAKPPQERQERELEIAEEALEFAKAANVRAEKACAAAELDKAKAKADAAASANASSASASSSTSAPNIMCDSSRPFAVQSKRRHATGDEDDDECEMGDLDDKEEDLGPAAKRSKSTSSSSSSSEALNAPNAPFTEITRADMATQV